MKILKRMLFGLAMILIGLSFWQMLSQVQAEESDFRVSVNEVSPVGSDHDWAELYVQSGSGSISNFVLTDLDGTDSELANEPVSVATGDYIVLHWQSGIDETDLTGDSNENGYIDLYTLDSSLSGTDDQLVLRRDGEIIDAVIWSNYDGSLAASELIDNEFLLEQMAWQGNFSLNDQSGAVALAEIDQSIARSDLPDSDSKQDWQLLTIPTPGLPNIQYQEPVAPILSIQELGTGSVLLNWEAVSDVTKYELFEAIISEEYTDPLVELSADTEEYLVEDLSQDEVYFYKLRAWNEHDLYADSDEIEVHTHTSNEPPVASVYAPSQAFSGEEVVIQASDSFDPENEPLIFEWSEDESNPELDLLEVDGEEARFMPNEGGLYKFSLLVSDGELDSEPEEAEVEILLNSAAEYSEEIIINEILPNPTGSDNENEFIELKNLSNEAVNLEDWQLDDISEAGSSPYTMPAKTIQTDELIVIKRSESGLALNNDADEVNLLNPDGELVDSVSYDENFGEGESYARTENGDFAKTDIVTEGQENEFPEEEEEEEEDTSSSTSTSSSDNEEEICQEISLAEAKDQIDEEICLEAYIGSTWGQLGAKIFYIFDEDTAIQGYSSEEIGVEIGQKIYLEGEISELSTGLRFKVTDWEELSGTKELLALPISAEAFADDYLGRLLEVSGEVVKNSGNTFYLQDETGEIKVVIKDQTGIVKPETPKGSLLTLSGILDKTSSGYRILPRSLEDFELEEELSVSPTSLSKTGPQHFGLYAATMLLVLVVRKKILRLR